MIFEHGLGGSEYYDSTPEKIYQYFDTRAMHVSTLSGFIKKESSLTSEQLNIQFYKRLNYYFIGHT